MGLWSTVKNILTGSSSATKSAGTSTTKYPIIKGNVVTKPSTGINTTVKSVTKAVKNSPIVKNSDLPKTPTRKSMNPIQNVHFNYNGHSYSFNDYIENLDPVTRYRNLQIRQSEQSKQDLHVAVGTYDEALRKHTQKSIWEKYNKNEERKSFLEARKLLGTNENLDDLSDKQADITFTGKQSDTALKKYYGDDFYNSSNQAKLIGLKALDDVNAGKEPSEEFNKYSDFVTSIFQGKYTNSYANSSEVGAGLSKEDYDSLNAWMNRYCVTRRVQNLETGEYEDVSYILSGSPPPPTFYDNDGNKVDKQELNNSWSSYLAYQTAQFKQSYDLDTSHAYEVTQMLADWDAQDIDTNNSFLDIARNLFRSSYNILSNDYSKEDINYIINRQADREVEAYIKRYFINPLKLGRLDIIANNTLVNLGETLDYGGVGMRAIESTLVRPMFSNSKLVDGQESWVSKTVSSDVQKQIMELGGYDAIQYNQARKEITSQPSGSITKSGEEAIRKIREAGLWKEFCLLEDEYLHDSTINSFDDFKESTKETMSALKAAYTTHEQYLSDSGSLGQDLVNDLVFDPTIVFSGVLKSGAKGVAGSAAKDAFKAGVDNLKVYDSVAYKGIADVDTFKRVVNSGQFKHTVDMLSSRYINDMGKNIYSMNPKDMSTKIHNYSQYLIHSGITDNPVLAERLRTAFEVGVTRTITNTLDSRLYKISRSMHTIADIQDVMDSASLKLIFGAPYVGVKSYKLINRGFKKLLSSLEAVDFEMTQATARVLNNVNPKQEFNITDLPTIIAEIKKDPFHESSNMDVTRQYEAHVLQSAYSNIFGQITMFRNLCDDIRETFTFKGKNTSADVRKSESARIQTQLEYLIKQCTGGKQTSIIEFKKFLEDLSNNQLDKMVGYGYASNFVDSFLQVIGEVETALAQMQDRIDRDTLNYLDSFTELYKFGVPKYLDLYETNPEFRFKRPEASDSDFPRPASREDYYYQKSQDIVNGRIYEEAYETNLREPDEYADIIVSSSFPQHNKSKKFRKSSSERELDRYTDRKMDRKEVEYTTSKSTREYDNAEEIMEENVLTQQLEYEASLHQFVEGMLEALSKTETNIKNLRIRRGDFLSEYFTIKLRKVHNLKVQLEHFINSDEYKNADFIGELFGDSIDGPFVYDTIEDFFNEFKKIKNDNTQKLNFESDDLKILDVDDNKMHNPTVDNLVNSTLNEKDVKYYVSIIKEHSSSSEFSKLFDDTTDKHVAIPNDANWYYEYFDNQIKILQLSPSLKAKRKERLNAYIKARNKLDNTVFSVNVGEDTRLIKYQLDRFWVFNKLMKLPDMKKLLSSLQDPKSEFRQKLETERSKIASSNLFRLVSNVNINGKSIPADEFIAHVDTIINSAQSLNIYNILRSNLESAGFSSEQQVAILDKLTATSPTGVMSDITNQHISEIVSECMVNTDTMFGKYRFSLDHLRSKLTDFNDPIYERFASELENNIELQNKIKELLKGGHIDPADDVNAQIFASILFVPEAIEYFNSKGNGKVIFSDIETTGLHAEQGIVTDIATKTWVPLDKPEPVIVYEDIEIPQKSLSSSKSLNSTYAKKQSAMYAKRFGNYIKALKDLHLLHEDLKVVERKLNDKRYSKVNHNKFLQEKNSLLVKIDAAERAKSNYTDLDRRRTRGELNNSSPKKESVKKTVQRELSLEEIVDHINSLPKKSYKVGGDVDFWNTNILDDSFLKGVYKHDKTIAPEMRFSDFCLNHKEGKSELEVIQKFINDNPKDAIFVFHNNNNFDFNFLIKRLEILGEDADSKFLAMRARDDNTFNTWRYLKQIDVDNILYTPDDQVKLYEIIQDYFSSMRDIQNYDGHILNLKELDSCFKALNMTDTDEYQCLYNICEYLSYEKMSLNGNVTYSLFHVDGVKDLTEQSIKLIYGKDYNRVQKIISDLKSEVSSVKSRAMREVQSRYTSYAGIPDWMKKPFEHWTEDASTFSMSRNLNVFHLRQLGVSDDDILKLLSVRQAYNAIESANFNKFTDGLSEDNYVSYVLELSQKIRNDSDNATRLRSDREFHQGMLSLQGFSPRTLENVIQPATIRYNIVTELPSNPKLNERYAIQRPYSPYVDRYVFTKDGWENLDPHHNNEYYMVDIEAINKENDEYLFNPSSESYLGTTYQSIDELTDSGELSIMSVAESKSTELHKTSNPYLGKVDKLVSNELDKNYLWWQNRTTAYYLLSDADLMESQIEQLLSNREYYLRNNIDANDVQLKNQLDRFHEFAKYRSDVKNTVADMHGSEYMVPIVSTKDYESSLKHRLYVKQKERIRNDLWNQLTDDLVSILYSETPSNMHYPFTFVPSRQDVIDYTKSVISNRVDIRQYDSKRFYIYKREIPERWEDKFYADQKSPNFLDRYTYIPSDLGIQFSSLNPIMAKQYNEFKRFYEAFYGNLSNFEEDFPPSLIGFESNWLRIPPPKLWVNLKTFELLQAYKFKPGLSDAEIYSEAYDKAKSMLPDWYSEPKIQRNSEFTDEVIRGDNSIVYFDFDNVTGHPLRLSSDKILLGSNESRYTSFDGVTRSIDDPYHGFDPEIYKLITSKKSVLQDYLNEFETRLRDTFSTKYELDTRSISDVLGVQKLSRLAAPKSKIPKFSFKYLFRADEVVDLFSVSFNRSNQSLHLLNKYQRFSNTFKKFRKQPTINSELQVALPYIRRFLEEFKSTMKDLDTSDTFYYLSTLRIPDNAYDLDALYKTVFSLFIKHSLPDSKSKSLDSRIMKKIINKKDGIFRWFSEDGLSDIPANDRALVRNYMLGKYTPNYLMQIEDLLIKDVNSKTTRMGLDDIPDKPIEESAEDFNTEYIEDADYKDYVESMIDAGYVDESEEVSMEDYMKLFASNQSINSIIGDGKSVSHYQYLVDKLRAYLDSEPDISEGYRKALHDTLKRTEDYFDELAKKASYDLNVSYKKESAFEYSNSEVRGNMFNTEGHVYFNDSTGKVEELHINPHTATQASTTGHETGHIVFRLIDSKRLVSKAKEYAEAINQYGDYDKWFTDSYIKSSNLPDYPEAMRVEEITVNIIGEHLYTDDAFVVTLINHRPSIFKHVYEGLVYMLRYITAGSNAERALMRFQREYRQAYLNASENARTLTHTPVKINNIEELKPAESIAFYSKRNIDKLNQLSFRLSHMKQEILDIDKLGFFTRFDNLEQLSIFENLNTAKSNIGKLYYHHIAGIYEECTNLIDDIFSMNREGRVAYATASTHVMQQMRLSYANNVLQALLHPKRGVSVNENLYRHIMFSHGSLVIEKSIMHDVDYNLLLNVVKNDSKFVFDDSGKYLIIMFSDSVGLEKNIDEFNELQLRFKGEKKYYTAPQYVVPALDFDELSRTLGNKRIAQQLINLDSKLKYLNGNASKSPFFGAYDMAKHTDFLNSLPQDLVKKSMHRDYTLDNGMWSTVQSPDNILGNYHFNTNFEYGVGDPLTDGLLSYFHGLVYKNKASSYYINALFGDSSPLMLKHLLQSFGEHVSTEEFFRMIKANPDQVVCSLRLNANNKTGFEIVRERIDTVSDLNLAMRRDCILIPFDLFTNSAEIINSATKSNLFMKVWSNLIRATKIGQIMWLGTALRNMIDAYMKMSIEADSVIEPLFHLPKAMSDLHNYNETSKRVVEMTKHLDHLSHADFEDFIYDHWSAFGSKLSADEYLFIDGWMKSSLFGGDLTSFQRYAKEVNVHRDNIDALGLINDKHWAGTDIKYKDYANQLRHMDIREVRDLYQKLIGDGPTTQVDNYFTYFRDQFKAKPIDEARDILKKDYGESDWVDLFYCYSMDRVGKLDALDKELVSKYEDFIQLYIRMYELHNLPGDKVLQFINCFSLDRLGRLHELDNMEIFNYSIAADTIIDSLMHPASRKLPTFGSAMDNLASTVMLPQTIVEQSVRLAQYRVLESQGYTRSQIFQNITESQFNYNLKSSKLKNLENIFPFFNFTYMNLLYWCNKVENDPNIFHSISQIYTDMTAQNPYQTQDDDDDLSTLNAMLYGNIPLTDSGFYFKLNPSFIDAYNTIYGGPNEILKKLYGPLQLGARTSLRLMGADASGLFDSSDLAPRYDGNWKTELASFVPYLGTVVTKWYNADKYRPWETLAKQNGTPLQMVLVAAFPSAFGVNTNYNRSDNSIYKLSGDMWYSAIINLINSGHYSEANVVKLVSEINSTGLKDITDGSDGFLKWQAELAAKGYWYDSNLGKVVPIDQYNEIGLNDPKLSSDWNELCKEQLIRHRKIWDANKNEFVSFSDYEPGGLNRVFDFQNNPNDWNDFCELKKSKLGLLWDANQRSFVDRSHYINGYLNEKNLKWDDVVKYNESFFGTKWDANQGKFVNPDQYIEGGLNMDNPSWSELSTLKRVIDGKTWSFKTNQFEKTSESQVVFILPASKIDSSELTTKREKKSILPSIIESVYASDETESYSIAGLTSDAMRTLINSTRVGALKTEDGKYILTGDKEHDAKVFELILSENSSSLSVRGWKNYKWNKYGFVNNRRTGVGVGFMNQRLINGVYGRDNRIYRRPYNYNNNKYAGLRMAANGHKSYDEFYKFQYQYNFQYQYHNPVYGIADNPAAKLGIAKYEHLRTDSLERKFRTRNYYNFDMSHSVKGFTVKQRLQEGKLTWWNRY